MKKMFSLVLATSFLSFSSICHATSGDCANFLSDFKQMTVAADSIQQSLISNHDMMADSIDTYADGLKESSGKAYKKIVENMYKAGESVRKRKTKAQDISKEFALKANELLKTAEKCVKK